MGKKHSTLSDEHLERLRSKTQFSDEEIQKWHDIFRKDCPSGKMSRGKFEELYCSYFPDGDAKKFARHCFRTFDKNNDGTIDFREFLCSLSIISRGSQEEKLKWAFSMYDIDGSGTINREEMLEIVRAVFKVAGKNKIKLARDESTPERMAHKIFSLLDANKDGNINEAEFVAGAKQYPTFMKLLENPSAM